MEEKYDCCTRWINDSKVNGISTLPLADQLYGGMPGTSMAAPVVSGAVALVLAENKANTFWS